MIPQSEAATNARIVALADPPRRCAWCCIGDFSTTSGTICEQCRKELEHGTQSKASHQPATSQPKAVARNGSNEAAAMEAVAAAIVALIEKHEAILERCREIIPGRCINLNLGKVIDALRDSRFQALVTQGQAALTDDDEMQGEETA